MRPLLNVQKAALDKSAGRRGFAFYMEQGLGKTKTAQADFLRNVETRHAGRSVVIAPNSFKGGWVEEAEKDELPINQLIWESGDERRFNIWAQKPSNMPRQVVINYEALRGESTFRAIRDWAAAHRTFGIIDESIKLKQYNSAQTKAVLEMTKSWEFSRVLSGKPITQGPHDLWAQMRAIYEINGFMYHPFKTAFCKMGGFKMKQIIGAQNEDILAERIDHAIFRATKVDWTDLPPKTYTYREYRLTGEIKEHYAMMHNEFMTWLSETENVTVDQAITKYMKLQQIQCGWIYDENRVPRQLVDDSDNPRLQLLLDVLNDEVSGKVAIPYHHKPVFDQLLNALGGKSKCAYITGGMKTHEIDEQKRRFNEDASVRYILLQDDASKYGHTLLGLPKPGDMCYTMVFYENNYSLDTRSQIEDRVHRTGQLADSVSYIDLVGTPLDRDCVRALQRKEHIFQAVFGRWSRH